MNKSIIINDPNIDTNGTHLEGYVTTTGAYLEAKLGPIQEDPYGDKVVGSWYIQKETGEDRVVATIYCWKVEEIPWREYEWHIGGHTSKAVDLVEEVTGLSASYAGTNFNSVFGF